MVLFAFVLAALAYLWNESQPLHITNKIESSYDFIIVGAGTSGSVLASRLSEDEGVTVLLLEAGDDASCYSEYSIPYRTLALQAAHKADWNDFTTPQTAACQAMRDKRCRLMRGKLVGGTSSIDCMTYVRGSRSDYDRWAMKYGCAGWSYNDVLPYFIKSQHNTNTEFSQSGYHGSGGPLIVSDIKPTSLHEALIVAAEELGHKAIDINGRSQLGVMHLQSTAKRGQRVSTARAFLHPASHRQNLNIATLATVNKVLFEGKRAVGVVFERNAAVLTVRANREVILAAGTIGSAQLLMLSGVGPKEHLTSLQIPIVADLPVGSGLQMPVGFVSSEFMLKEPIAVTDFKAKSVLTMMDYYLFGSGYMSCPCHLEGSLFTQVADNSSDALPDVEIRLLNTLLGNSPESISQFADINNFNQHVVELFHGNVNMQDGLSLMPVVLHPVSRGVVHLQSSDAHSSPLIDPQLLTASQDIRTAIEGVRVAEKFASTVMFKSLGAKLLHRMHPMCNKLDAGSNAYWECYIRHTAFPIVQRMSGTCRMGPSSDPQAVVDTQLRVLSVDGLRVVDASVMPEIVSGDTNVAVVMIAERAADFIKGMITVTPVNFTAV